MCVWLKVGILPFTVSSSASVEQFGCGMAGVATRLVRHERQCLDGGWGMGGGTVTLSVPLKGTGDANVATHHHSPDSIWWSSF